MIEMGLKAIIHKIQTIMKENDGNLTRTLWSCAAGHGLTNFIPDKTFLKLGYRIKVGKKLNLQDPVSFNEKLQWLKLYDRNPEYTMMVDKYAVKKWVADKIGDEYIIPTMGIWKHFDEIDFDRLPNQFVLKCTHDSGGLVIVKDKSKLDEVEAKKKLEKCLRRNYYWAGREWPYKNVQPMIIAEKYMTDESGTELKDYKIFNFSGEPKLIEVDYDRFVEHKRNLYTTDWQYIEAAIQYPTDPMHPIERPKQLEKMLDLARTLSAGISHVRTDFYCIDDCIYFGELTFYHGSGFENFTPEGFNEEMGKWIKLSRGGYILISDFAVFVLWDETPIDSMELMDYKFLCFEGKVRCVFTVTERFSEDGLKVTFFDPNWNPLPFERHYPKSAKPIPKPYHLEKMVKLAEELSSDIPFVRVDLYESGGRIFFGELTFYPGSGFEEFIPEKWDNLLGEWIKLPEGKG